MSMCNSVTQASLIITTYNWPQALELVLKSIMRQNVLPAEVVIADDGSGAETRQMIEAYQRCFPVPLQHAWQEDDGYRINKVRNLAIRTARFPYIIQIDGDVLLDKNFVKDHLSYAARNRMIVGRRVNISEVNTRKLTETGDYGRLTAFRSRLTCALHNLLFYSSRSVKGLRGCNVSFWKEDAYAINGYDESMTSKGPNDKEFGMRMVNSGVRTYNMKYYGIQHHLHHSEGSLRNNYQFVKNIYMSTINTGKIACEKGLKSA